MTLEHPFRSTIKLLLTNVCTSSECASFTTKFQFQSIRNIILPPTDPLRYSKCSTCRSYRHLKLVSYAISQKRSKVDPKDFENMADFQNRKMFWSRRLPLSNKHGLTVWFVLVVKLHRQMWSGCNSIPPYLDDIYTHQNIHDFHQNSSANSICPTSKTENRLKQTSSSFQQTWSDGMVRSSCGATASDVKWKELRIQGTELGARDGCYNITNQQWHKYDAYGVTWKCRCQVQFYMTCAI